MITYNEFIEMCKNMVLEYYNRYLVSDNKHILLDNIKVLSNSCCDSNYDMILKSKLIVDINQELEYNITLIQKKNEDNYTIKSFITKI